MSNSVNKLSVKNVNRTKFLKDTTTNKLQAAIMTIVSGIHSGNIYIQQKKKEKKKMYKLILAVMGEIGHPFLQSLKANNFIYNLVLS